MTINVEIIIILVNKKLEILWTIAEKAFYRRIRLRVALFDLFDFGDDVSELVTFLREGVTDRRRRRCFVYRSNDDVLFLEALQPRRESTRWQPLDSVFDLIELCVSAGKQPKNVERPLTAED